MHRRFITSLHRYSKSDDSVVVFMEEAKKKLNIVRWEDWYNVGRKQLIEVGGEHALRRFNGSPSALIMNCYPEHNWIVSNFLNVPRNYWKSKQNIMAFMEEAKRRLSIGRWEDWYNVGHKQFVELGGRTLLNQFNGSPSSLIMSTYPEYDWNKLEFKHAPLNYWSNKDNIVTFMEEAKLKLNIHRWEDWYNVGYNELIEVGANSILYHFNGSASALIMYAYPQYEWNEHNFSNIPRNYWKNEDNVQRFMRKVEKELEMTSYEDWYEVSRPQFEELGGRYLLERYGSLSAVVMNLLTDHKWNVYRFKRVTTGWTARAFLDELIRKQQQSNPLDLWATMHRMKKLPGGAELIRRYGSAAHVLRYNGNLIMSVLDL